MKNNYYLIKVYIDTNHKQCYYVNIKVLPIDG